MKPVSIHVEVIYALSETQPLFRVELAEGATVDTTAAEQQRQNLVGVASKVELREVRTFQLREGAIMYHLRERHDRGCILDAQEPLDLGPRFARQGQETGQRQFAIADDKTIHGVFGKLEPVLCHGHPGPTDQHRHARQQQPQTWQQPIDHADVVRGTGEAEELGLPVGDRAHRVFEQVSEFDQPLVQFPLAPATVIGEAPPLVELGSGTVVEFEVEVHDFDLVSSSRHGPGEIGHAEVGIVELPGWGQEQENTSGGGHAAPRGSRG